MSNLITVPIAEIDAGDRLRPVDAAHALMLAESIRETGLRMPVEIRPRNGRKGPRFSLIAGGHRLWAAKHLGWEEIQAFVLALDDDHARMAEIDENLVRHELNPLDRAMFLAERKALYEKLHPEAAHGGDRRGDQVAKFATWSFAKDTAERCGLADRTIRLAVQIATNLSADSRRRVAGTLLAKKQAELLALSQMTPDHQALALDLLLAPTPTVRTVEAARRVVQGVRDAAVNETEQQFSKLVDAWRRAGAPARRQFLAHLGAAGELVGPAIAEVA